MWPAFGFYCLIATKHKFQLFYDLPFPLPILTQKSRNSGTISLHRLKHKATRRLLRFATSACARYITNRLNSLLHFLSRQIIYLCLYVDISRYRAQIFSRFFFVARPYRALNELRMPGLFLLQGKIK